MVTLETERLIIRDNIPGDLHDLYELTTDEHAMRFMKSTKIETRKEAKKNLKISIRESKRKTRTKYYFVIIDRTTEEYIGAIGYVVGTNGDSVGNVVELGYFIKGWNQV